ncbi:hypothetical protein OJF2_22330 [Aquisphaera giovannonii]|uniref:Alpha/beta hydrolase family protein n=1 Tax=Aquisphaera giovannonii TaxID=406548 RepID=A0A5B9W0D8_9BACT|nr:hypothetical protein [Aquisphaera giovannonii]QEH33727.1 hypothetical protein OJF2_22330 [Aquisphaera giovannonii]
MPAAHLTVLCAALLGWSDNITIQPSRGERGLFSSSRDNAGIDRPSDRTHETLKRYDLERTYRRRPDLALQSLEKLARKQPEAELVYALAELSWVEGLKQERWRKGEAMGRFLDAVGYAHDFLFDPELAAGRGPTDPRFLLACKLYNAGLERIIRTVQSKDPINPQGTIKLKIDGREQVLQVALSQSPWTAADIHKLILCSDYEVSGLAKSRNQYGLGVPLIAVRATDPKKEDRKAGERFYPDEMTFALTAFLYPNSRLRDPANEGDGPRRCSLALIDPVVQRTVASGSSTIAIEADLTTPLAYMWSRTDLERYRWAGLMRPEANLGRANLLMIRPYEPGKIPVVMVHGLISSPLAWIPMLDELLRDPVIQSKYQFILYMYPTGVPLPIAASSLRDALGQAKETFSPGDSDPAFDRMVLLGHSMGGLLSHLMTVSSGDQFWRLNSDQSFDTILGPKEVLGDLQHLLFFEPLPFVSRAVFLATPHRGSGLSRSVVGRVGAGLINDPDHVTKLLTQLVRDNPDAFQRRFRRFPSSIETLDTDSKTLLAVLAMKQNPAVTYHSIIGSLRPGPTDESTDGVVAYKSSHLDGVASEVVVRSDHGVQASAMAIREVRRILHEHIGSGSQVAQGRPGLAATGTRPRPAASAEEIPAPATAAAAPPNQSPAAILMEPQPTVDGEPELLPALPR